MTLLISGCFELPVMLIDELLLGLSDQSISNLNVDLLQTCLFDFIHDYLFQQNKIKMDLNNFQLQEATDQSRFRSTYLIEQFLVYLIQEGLLLIGPTYNTFECHGEAGIQLVENYQSLLNKLEKHKLVC